MSLRILMVGWELPPHNSGGLGTACAGLCAALTAAGARPIFLLPEAVPLAAYPFPVIFADVGEPKRSPLNLAAASYRSPLDAEAMAKLYGFNLLAEVALYAQRVRRLAAQQEVDVIHAHDWLAFPAGLAAKEVTGKPLVLHVHATEFDRGGGNGVNQAVYEIEQKGLRLADKIIAVSQWTKDLLIKHYGIPAEKISVVHNGVKTTDYQSNVPGALESLRARGGKIVLFVGRITLQKGPDYFVQLAKRVLDFEPKTYFVMVGSGDMVGQVMQSVASLGLSDKFFFPGFLRGRELERLYRSADLYILPSVSEPFGITPLEALANGTPVMVSKQSGVAEVLSHALKVDFWDIDEMTNQTVAVLRHQSLRQVLREYGQAEVGKVTWDAAAEKCLGVYRQLAC